MNERSVASGSSARWPIVRDLWPGILLVLLHSWPSSAAEAQQRRERQRRAPAGADSTVTVPASERTPLFDAHVHLNDAAMQRMLMSDVGVERAVVFWGARSDNASIRAAAAENGRLIPFVSVSPERERYRELWTRGDTALLVELEEALRSGAYRGIGEISVTHFEADGFPEADFSPLGPSMRGIMRLAERYRVPVVIHCEITRLSEFSRLLAEFPGVTVIWAHGGYTPYYLARRMLERHPNLVYELSARTWERHPRSPDYTIFRDATTVWAEWLALIEEHRARFVVGTDAAHRNEAGERRKLDRIQLFLRQLTPETREAVARGNMNRLTSK